MAGSQETGTSLMDLITADPAPPGNPAFPPLGVNPTPDRTKPTPPRKSTSQPPTTDLLVSIKAPTPTKSSLAPLKQKRKVGIIIPNPLNDHLPFPIMFLNSLSLSFGRFFLPPLKVLQSCIVGRMGLEYLAWIVSI